MGFILFRVVYGVVPHGPLDLNSLLNKSCHLGQVVDFFDDIQLVHKQPHANFEKSVAKYKVAADVKCC